MRVTFPLFVLMTAITQLAACPAVKAVDYAGDVRPILVRHCIRCHGPDQQESGLRLDVGSGILLGGSSGRVVVPGSGEQSRLLRVVKGEDSEIGRMPPEGPGLAPREVALIEAWIHSGAQVVGDGEELRRTSSHWSLQIPVRPELSRPRHESWVRNAIDVFVLAKLEAAGIDPSPEASPATLLRRVSLDLTGLPPTAVETASFLNDSRPDAFERLVDRLLASTAYGERWGRHWLDQARYADSNGFTRDFARQIWRYRDWVINAMNSGMPFDQFTVEQFAGDMLPDPSLDQLIATGFHRNTLVNEEGGTDSEQFRVDAVADRVATTGVVYLGLTMGCARCHEHKYDPISQRDYYRMFALLNSCEEPQIDAPLPWQASQGLVARRDAIREKIAGKEKELDQLREALMEKQLEWEATITPEFRSTLPGPTQAAIDKELTDRDDVQKRLVSELFKTTATARDAFPLVREIAELRESEPAIPTTMILRERDEPRATHIHRRGNFLATGAQVEPGTPQVFHSLAGDEDVSDRLDFANWLVAPNNPLTARVVVNRSWQHLFGRGIVETENDFGSQGSPPTHPQLLDWLAVEFVESGWNVKAMLRLLVTSATYRQSSRHRRELVAVDPANRWLGRQSRLRLEAETIRDSCLVASNLLTRKVGGPSVYPPQPSGVFAFTQDPKPWNTEQGEDRYRRGMYTFLWRSSPYPALALFDAPDGNVTCTRRVRSNTPLQSLTLANGEQFVECARSLAKELLFAELATDEQRLELAFRRCLTREPSGEEKQRLLKLLAAQRDYYYRDKAMAMELAGGAENAPIELAAWVATARVLMNLDEFITRE